MSPSVCCKIFFLPGNLQLLLEIPQPVCFVVVVVVVDDAVVLFASGRTSRARTPMPFVSSGTFSVLPLLRAAPPAAAPHSGALDLPRPGARPRVTPSPRRREPFFLLGLHFEKSVSILLLASS